MRIKQLCIFFLLNSFIVIGQKRNIALKVFLEDAYTEKNVKEAKVTLEGFEIPEIQGKYDRKGKFYYFTEIPEGYNTVMVYHEKYNEKGFQKQEKFPSELSFILSKPTDKNQVVKNEFGSVLYINYYVEDPFHISIESKLKKSYNEFITSILDFIKINNLEIELVNPYFEREKVDYGVPSYQSEGYPYIKEYSNIDYKKKFILPLMSGKSTVSPENDKTEDICFFFRKKDGTKFKRFNDPILKKIRLLGQDKFIVASVILNKKGNEDLNGRYEIDYSIKDKLNKKYNQKMMIDSSRLFLYNAYFRNKPKNFKLNYFLEPQYFEIPKQNKIYEVKTDEETIDFAFIYLERKISIDFFKSIYIDKHLINELTESTGLGIIDLYEYNLKNKN